MERDDLNDTVVDAHVTATRQRQHFADALTQMARGRNPEAFKAFLTEQLEFPQPSPVCGSSQWIDDLRAIAQASLYSRR